MKAKELMIGDWVEVISSDHLKYVQVVEIYDKSVLVKDGKDEWEPEEINLANIQAIPLTEEILLANGFAELIPLNAEILEKNGFNKESDFRWSAPDIKKYCIVNEKVFDGPDSWWFCFNVPDKHKLGHFCLFECGNVHELQHILKSGKSNIKIEL